MGGLYSSRKTKYAYSQYMGYQAPPSAVSAKIG